MTPSDSAVRAFLLHFFADADADVADYLGR